MKADSPYRTVQELMEAARKTPGKLSYATAGKGTDGHFNGEILTGVANLKVKHVPFKGGGEVAPAVMGGHVDFGMGAATTFVPLEQGGKLRMLAITGKVRMKAVPNAPTFDELGIKGDFIDNWAGAFVAAGTPQPIVDALVKAAEKVIKSKEFVDRIEKTGGLVQYVIPADFRATIQRDKNIAAEIARKVGM